MAIPSESDWRSESWSLDTEWAYRNFFGKSLDEAAALFVENAFRFQEDLGYMPSPLFRYYIQAYTCYLLSGASAGDYLAADSFIRLIASKSERQPEDIGAVWWDIEPVLRRLALDQDYFEADWVTYGSFRSRIDAIVQRGFETSFDTAGREIVPPGTTIRAMAGTYRTVSADVAVQILQYSGIHAIGPASTRDEVVQAFGPPDASGGGQELPYRVPPWMAYRRSECAVRFEFDDDRISSVMFLPIEDVRWTSSYTRHSGAITGCPTKLR